MWHSTPRVSHMTMVKRQMQNRSRICQNLNSLGDNSMSQRALDLLHTMAKEGGDCSPCVVAYSTVIHGFFREREISKACNLFHEMIHRGVVPDVVIYSLVIDALCKARAMDEAELVLRPWPRGPTLNGPREPPCLRSSTYPFIYEKKRLP